MGNIKRDHWTESEVLLLPSGEHDYLERKSGALLTDKDKFAKVMAKAISALANSGGGYIIFGQNDDGSFDGLPEKEDKTPTREWLEQKLPYLVRYPLQDFRVHKVEPDTPTLIPANTIVVVIEIGDSNLAPHQSAKDDLYYYRVGGHSKPAPHFYLETLRGRSRFPSPKVVRVWFDTVVNPLLSDLAMQHDCLHKRSWKFEHRTQSINGVSLLTQQQSSQYTVTGNQEQFFEIYTNIKDALNKREEAYLPFHEEVVEFYKIIRESDALLHIYKSCTSSESLQSVRKLIRDPYAQSLSDADLLNKLYGGTDEQFLDELAQYIVNRTGEISEQYTHHPFWNTHGKSFLSLLRSAEAGYSERHIKEASESLLNEGLLLARLLEETKKQLSQQHGVPYYQPTKKIEQPFYEYMRVR